MFELEKVRVDKWLWSIRMFKTRTAATDACNSGKVKLDGTRIKPSQLVKIGDELQFAQNGDVKILKVIKLIDKRVGAPIAITCYEDKSPPSIHDQSQPSFFYQYEIRDRGVGRPTKKDRRDIERFKD